MNQTRQRNMLAVPLIAAVTGAVLGVLFAPRSGKETRAKLRESMGRVKRQARDKAASAKHQAEESLSRARRVLKTTTDYSKREVDNKEIS